MTQDCTTPDPATPPAVQSDGSSTTSTTVFFAAVMLLAAAVVLLLVWFAGRSAITTETPGAYRGPYDPVEAGEELPDGFRQVLPRDAIRPVYDPEFVLPDSAGWDDDIEVIGVFFGGEAKAYPVSFLNRREIVVDELDGLPILVSW